MLEIQVSLLIVPRGTVRKIEASLASLTDSVAIYTFPNDRPFFHPTFPTSFLSEWLPQPNAAFVWTSSTSRHTKQQSVPTAMSVLAARAFRRIFWMQRQQSRTALAVAQFGAWNLWRTI